MKKLISIIVLMFGFVMANSQTIIRVNPEDFPIGAPTLNTHIYSQTGGPSFKFKISAIDSLITASGLSNQNLVQVNDTTFYIDGTNDTIIITGTRQRLAVDTSSTDSVTLSISSGNAIIFSIEDLDADSTNEIQTLGLGDKTDSTQVLALSNGGLVSIQIRDADYDPTNELQDLIQLNDTSFVISGTNDTIIISSPEGTDDQIISISNDTVYLEDGGFIVLPAQTVNTDDQVISLINDTIYLEDGGFVVLPSLFAANGIKVRNDSILMGGTLEENTTINQSGKTWYVEDVDTAGYRSYLGGFHANFGGLPIPFLGTAIVGSSLLEAYLAGVEYITGTGEYEPRLDYTNLVTNHKNFVKVSKGNIQIVMRDGFLSPTKYESQIYLTDSLVLIKADDVVGGNYSSMWLTTDSITISSNLLKLSIPSKGNIGDVLTSVDADGVARWVTPTTDSISLVFEYTPTDSADANYLQGQETYDADYYYIKIEDTTTGSQHLWRRKAWDAW